MTENIHNIDAFIIKAKEYACKMHQSCNHKYDKNKEYSFHLLMVVNFIEKYKHLIPDGKFAITVASGWNHDTIEDTPETYNDVKKVLGEIVAEIVYKLSNEKGRTRDERANHKYYREIRQCKIATFVKICDRLANVTYSEQQGSNMFKKYRKEHQHFTEELYCDEYSEMFDELDIIFGIFIVKNLRFKIKIAIKRFINNFKY